MEIILDKIRSHPQYLQLLKQIQDGKEQPGLSLPRSARLPILAALHLDLNRPILLVTDRADHALSLFDELGFWVKSPRYLFAEPTPLFYEEAAWGVNTRRERLQVLTALTRYHLPFAEKPEIAPIVVTSARALMTRTIPRREFLKACKKFAAGQSVQPDALLRNWAEIGYQRVNTVLEQGQYSRRGGILDVWPPDSKSPIRLDFFGDEVETIRSFDPASQRTIEKLDSILVTPAREFIVQESTIGNGKSGAAASIDPLIKTNVLSEFHIPVLYQQSASLLDYLPSKPLVLIDDLSLVESMVAEVEEQAVKFRQDEIREGTLSPDYPIPYITWPELVDEFHGSGALELGQSSAIEGVDGLASFFTMGQRFAGRLKPFIDHAANLVNKNETLVIVSRQVERLEELWKEILVSGQSSADNQMPPIFMEASLSEGFIFDDLNLITDSEIFGWERPQPRETAGNCRNP